MGREHTIPRATGSPRPLSAAEREALNAVLSYADFPGRDTLREQIRAARVVGACGCGCASVDLAIEVAPPSGAIAYPIPNEATVLDDRGEAIGGVLVFARDGYLAQLEIYNNGEQPIDAFPPIDRLACTSFPR